MEKDRLGEPRKLDNLNLDKALTRWLKDLSKIVEFEDLADRESMWDSLMKRSVWIKALARDTLDLDAINETYCTALCELTDTIIENLVFMKSTASKLPRDIADRVLWEQTLAMFIVFGDTFSMLLSLASDKLQGKLEIIEQGEKLKQIIQAQDQASREKMKKYVS